MVTRENVGCSVLVCEDVEASVYKTERITVRVGTGVLVEGDR